MSEATGERMRKRTLVLKPSRRSSVLGSTSRRSLSLGGGGSKILDKSSGQTQRPAVRVLDEEGNNVTPHQLYQVDPGTVSVKASRFLVDEASAGSASDHTTVTGSFILPFSRSVFGSSRRSSQSTIESVNEEMEEIFSKRDLLFVVPDEKVIKHTVVEEMTEDVLNEVVEVFITESDSASLLDIPSYSTSVDADDAESIIETNNRYAAVDRNRMKSVDQSLQTLNRTTKNKLVQTVGPVRGDAATTVSTLDMSDDPELEQNVDSSEAKRTDSAEVGLESGTEKSGSLINSASTVSAPSSLKEVDMFGNILNTQSDVRLIMMSEKFQSSLFVMERSVLSSCFHLEQAAYRQVPPLQADPDRPLSKGAAESSPSLRRLWVFTCELSRGRSVNSMAWNKKNPDLLAVGYSELNSKNQKSGLVCCWSSKNPTWPERIFHLKSSVTSLNFSACNPGQLAVGMCDGTIAIYNVQSSDLKSHIFSSCECPNRHLSPVWQLRWIQQELSITGEKVEALFSVGADGRIRKWSVFNGVFDCTDFWEDYSEKTSPTLGAIL